jgi:hypothetical protein
VPIYSESRRGGRYTEDVSHTLEGEVIWFDGKRTYLFAQGHYIEVSPTKLRQFGSTNDLTAVSALSVQVVLETSGSIFGVVGFLTAEDFAIETAKLFGGVAILTKTNLPSGVLSITA